MPSSFFSLLPFLSQIEEFWRDQEQEYIQSKKIYIYKTNKLKGRLNYMTNGKEKGKRANEPLRETFLMSAQPIILVVISVFMQCIF